MSEQSLNRTSSHLFIVGRGDCCGGLGSIPEAEDLRRASPVLRELLDGMAPLFTVLLNNSAIPEPSQSAGTTYYAVAPALSSNGSFSVFTANTTVPFRCSQQDVRGHILVQRHSADHEGVVECMLDSAQVSFVSPISTPESNSQRCRFPVIGCRVIAHRSLGDVSTEVKEIRNVFSRDRMHCLVVLITSGSLVRRGDVDGASDCAHSSPSSPSREREGVAAGTEAAGWLAGEHSEEGGGPPPGATSEVFTSSSPAYSEATLSNHRVIPSWYDCRHGRRSVSPTTQRGSSSPADEASSLREILKATIVGSMVSSEVFDACLLSLDTDLAMFLSSYVCIDGYEDFIIARVNQIVESVVEHLLEELHAEQQAALEQRIAAASSAHARDRFQSLASDDGVSEDLRELIVVSFHTIVTARVAPFLTPHWRKVNHIEDYAFSHACRSLSRAVTVSRCLQDSGVAVKGGLLPGPEIMADAVSLTAQLDTPRSVLETLRMMETIISCIVSATSRFVTDVTADVCIPFLVYVLAHSQPVALPSTIRFLYSFMIGAYETTSLCYALTTFEAACTQLLHEYTSLVLSSYDGDANNAAAS